MDTILEQILKSPLLNEYSRIIQRKVEDEEKKRNQFYELISEQQKVEFIEGEIIYHSPVRNKHTIASDNLFNLIKNFAILKKIGKAKHEKVLIKLTRNDFEPDICFFRNEKADKFTKDLMFYPAPDFVAEIISESTESRDRGIKFEDYALHGVGEYWIIDPENQFIEQYILHEKKFEFFQKVSSGNLRSFEIDGFEIPVKAIFDENENLKTLINLTQNL